MISEFLKSFESTFFYPQDLKTGEVLANKIYESLKNCLCGLVKPVRNLLLSINCQKQTKNVLIIKAEFEI